MPRAVPGLADGGMNSGPDPQPCTGTSSDMGVSERSVLFNAAKQLFN
jgi:hypothetical protein